MKNKRILIVSLKAGAGHIKAAEAIEKAVEQKNKRTKKQENKIIVKTIDFLDYSTILSKKFYGQWYIDMVKMAPQFYEYLYHNIKPSSTNFRLIFDRINAQEFKKKVLDFKPDLIICTHFIPANLLTHWREKYNYDYKVWLTVTDYEAHELWVDNKIDFYFVANPLVARQMQKYGIKRSKMEITGIPIDPKFAKHVCSKTARKDIGIDKKFTVSIFSGGFGMGPVEEVFTEIANVEDLGQIIVICGNNKELRNKLKKLAKKFKKKIKILGFVDNVEQIMKVSDVMVSKPGGLTVSESLAIGTPLIISNPIPGQEEANSKFLLKNRAAFRADKPGDIAEIIKRVMKDKDILLKMRYNIGKIAKPRAATEIASRINKS